MSPTAFWTGWGIFRWTGHTKIFRPECLQRHFGRAGEYSVGQDSQIILDQNFSNDLLPNISSHHFCAHKLRLPEFTKGYILTFPLRSSHHFWAHKLRLPNITKAYLLTSLPTPEISPTALLTCGETTIWGTDDVFNIDLGRRQSVSSPIFSLFLGSQIAPT